MITAWTSHLQDQEQVKRFQESVKHSDVLDRLHDILTDMKKEEERAEVSRESYDSPNWDYRQAHRNGIISTLTQVMKLTDPDRRKQ